MTITQNPSAPLVAVVGATGIQGGSVIQALADSNKPYRIRGFTRDAAKPVAQALVAKGVEIVTISLVVDNATDVLEAFSGANMIFIVTNFWEHMDVDRETAEGKMMIDAAKAAGADRVVWSGLPASTNLSGGKIKHLVHFDGKAAVTDYARQSGLPFVDVQAGYYASNYHTSRWTAPVKLADGTFAVRTLLNPTSRLPVIDMVRDYGLYVRQAFESPVFPNGSEVRTGEYISTQDMAHQLSQVTGKTVVVEQITLEQWEKDFEGLGMPPHILLDLSDGFKWVAEFGYYGGKPTSSVEGLANRPHSWMDFVKAADWSEILA
ncbi:NAD(P)-binding protein [Mycena galopus ATCC 62051]|nr:NAD(P)-binding protein [Mycena galopus ATCC 62051]